MTAVNDPEEKAWQDGIQLARTRVAFAMQGADDPGPEPLSLEQAVKGLGDEETKALWGGFRWVMWSVRREVRCAERDIERLQAGLPPLGLT